MYTTLAQVNIGQQFKFSGGRGVSDIFPTIGSLVSVILPNLYILASVIFFILLIFGGLGLIMGAGNNDPRKTEQGKQAVTYAVIGFVLVFVSYWIVQIIELITGMQILSHPTL